MGYVECLHNGGFHRVTHFQNVGEAIALLLGFDSGEYGFDIVEHLVRHSQIDSGTDSRQIVLHQRPSVRVVVPLLVVAILNG